MNRAARLLAYGFGRGDRAWWTATSFAFAAPLVVLVLVAALFAGIQAETEERVADFYTHDTRVTRHGAAVIPAGTFDADDTARLSGPFVGHYESQVVLSRRGLLEAALFEEEGFDFQQPGTGGDARTDILIGVLLGVPFDDPAASARLEPYKVAGAWPTYDPDGPVPIILSAHRLAALLTSEERAALSSWPPPIEELQALRFELTAAILADGGGDVIRRPGRVAALYETGLETLDTLTLLAPIQHVRDLNGHDPDGPVYNVLLLSADGGGDRDAARDAGWSTEGPAAFTERFLGQLLQVVRSLGVTLSAALFVLPALLIGHGVTRQLATQERPLAVAHAIGVPRSTIRDAVVRLVTRAAIVALAVAAASTLILGLALHGWLPTLRTTPLPMDVHFGAVTIAAALGVLVASVAAATWLALRSQRRLDMATVLRSL